jgi:hypothetical protein
MSSYAYLAALRTLLPPTVQVAITVALGVLLLAVELTRTLEPESLWVGRLETAVFPGLLLFAMVLVVRSAGLLLG